MCVALVQVFKTAIIIKKMENKIHVAFKKKLHYAVWFRVMPQFEMCIQPHVFIPQFLETFFGMIVTFFRF